MTQDCGLIDLLEPGDVVMADKGFDIQHLLAPKKAILNIPPFMGGKEQLTLQEEADTRCIASVRIHVERASRTIVYYRELYPYLFMHSWIRFGLFVVCLLISFVLLLSKHCIHTRYTCKQYQCYNFSASFGTRLAK